MSYNLVTIDPSTRRLGWAVFKILEHKRQAQYLESGVVKLSPGQEDQDPSDDYDYVLRSDRMATEMTQLAQEHHAARVLIELPRVFASPTGEAAMRSNSITKLALCVGCIRGALRAHNFPVECVPVARWKGNCPKHITLHRISRSWHVSPADDNESDAVGIGDWFIRNILKYRPVLHNAKRVPS